MLARVACTIAVVAGMRAGEGSCLVSVLVAVAIPALALGAQDDAPLSGRKWPCLMVIDADLKPFANLGWGHSTTFREQCRTLGAARAVVIVRSSRETRRADGRITVSDDGTILGRIRVHPASRVLEYLAHELEHVVERVEGVDLLLESRRGGSRVVLIAGAYETRRANDAGLRVAREVQEATRARAKAR